ncbi:hypothetical protein NKG94_10495 [Micromonospora sp. M12]
MRGVNIFPTQIEELILRTRSCRRTSSASSIGTAGWTPSPCGWSDGPGSRWTPPSGPARRWSSW